jgi:hypothetical protein
LFDHLIELASFMAEVHRIRTIQDMINIHSIIIYPFIFSGRRARRVLSEIIEGLLFLIIHGEHTVSQVLLSSFMEFVRFRRHHNLL